MSTFYLIDKQNKNLTGVKILDTEYMALVEILLSIIVKTNYIFENQILFYF
jgi:hypothetical protein